MFLARKLVLAHFWVAFVAFLGAIVLGAWQMYIRSPLSAWINNPEHYYRSVTAHGTVMAYVLPTLVAMGFGYAISELALKRPLIGLRWAWAGFGLVVGGTVLAAGAMAAGKASVLYTFYPPMIGSPIYYFGVVLVVVGSWIWVALMSINLHAWRKENRGATVPLAMYGNVAGAYLWAWTSVGAAVEVLVLILPASLGLTDTINAGLARVLFSWTLHAIVYFWLMPAYIAFYTLFPRAIGGRLYSDTMGRVAFALFLVFSMPIGIHHLFADPQVGAGFKFVHAAMTAMVSIPTLLTVFTIVASAEIAGRLRGGRGTFGWIRALPWDRPMMLAVTFSFVMLGLGGAGGIINMSYQLNETVHNTQWVTGHFHLIFGGAIVIMYFMVAYELWPQLDALGAPARGVDPAAALALVHRHARALAAVALGRPARPAAADGVLRLPPSGARAAGMDRDDVHLRRAGPGRLGAAVRRHPRPGAPQAGRACRVHVRRCGASRVAAAVRAERLRAVGGDDDRPDGRELRLPDRAAGASEGSVGAGHSDREPVMAEPGAMSWRNPWVRGSVGVLVALTVVAMLVGFLWLPSAQADFSAQGLWASICRAAGVPASWGPATDAARDARPVSTEVVLERSMARDGDTRRRSAAARRWRSTARCATARTA